MCPLQPGHNWKRLMSFSLALLHPLSMKGATIHFTFDKRHDNFLTTTHRMTETLLPLSANRPPQSYYCRPGIVEWGNPFRWHNTIKYLNGWINITRVINIVPLNCPSAAGSCLWDCCLTVLFLSLAILIFLNSWFEVYLEYSLSSRKDWMIIDFKIET